MQSNVEVTNICLEDMATKTPAPSRGSKVSVPKTEGGYLGVRVRMPVRDMLRNIRIAKGMDPKDLQGKFKKGDKKRVNTSADRRNNLKKRQTKSLEELAIIVEVLEEDLKTSRSYRQPDKPLPPTLCTERSLGEDASPRSFPVEYMEGNELPLSPVHSRPLGNAAMYPVEDYNTYPSPTYSQCNVPMSSYGCFSSDDSDDYRCSSQQGMACSPCHSEYQATCASPLMEAKGEPLDWCGGMSPGSQEEEWRCLAFFLAQVEREERYLRKITDRELLAPDENGRLFLHRVVEEGKRALVYVVAKRMAQLKKLDAKDFEGKTAHHLAAQRNQHLMVADLISLGANMNERDRLGKTCLHLSAEHGYVSVLEVLKNSSKHGMCIELEATDVNGLSALQCAAVALSNIIKELERSESPHQARLLTLRKNQLMESLECLLEMECHLHRWDHQDVDYGRVVKYSLDSHKGEEIFVVQSSQDKAPCSTLDGTVF